MAVLSPGPAASGRRAFHPLRELTIARVKEFLREPEAVFWTFFFPILLSVALGLAFRNRGEEPVYVGVLAEPGAALTVDLLERVQGVHAQVLSADSAALALRRGDVGLIVVREGQGYRYRFDPTRPESRIARLVADDALQAGAGRRDVLRTRSEHVRERGSRYIDFLIPGLIGLNLLSTGLWSVGYAVVQMRKEQLLKRYISTPLRRTDFLLAFMFARLLFLVVELAVILTFAVLVFKVPVRGSFPALLLVASVGGFAFTALGLLIASRSRTTEAVQGWMNLASVPMWVLSGVFFSSEHFPALMQPVIAALPLTASVDAMRAIMLEGASFAGVAGELGVLAAWALACTAIALPIFRWR